MFAIWMHFKGEYWIIENMCLHMRDVSFCQQVEPQTLIMEKKKYGKNNYGKNNYGKTGQSALAPWFHRKNQLWKQWPPPRIMEKKKGSDHIRDILNPYGEKSNYGKIGRRRRLSKLNVFCFSIILSVTINQLFLWPFSSSQTVWHHQRQSVSVQIHTSHRSPQSIDPIRSTERDPWPLSEKVRLANPPN